jgi:hypothetical protein
MPNPLAFATTLRFDLALAGRARVEIFDLGGRRVALVGDRELGPGRYAWPWDGRTAAGTAAAPGLYFVRFSAPGLAPETTRLVVVR